MDGFREIQREGRSCADKECVYGICDEGCAPRWTEVVRMRISP